MITIQEDIVGKIFGLAADIILSVNIVAVSMGSALPAVVVHHIAIGFKVLS